MQISENMENSALDDVNKKHSNVGISELLFQCNPLAALLTLEATLPSLGVLTKAKEQWRAADCLMFLYYLLVNAAKLFFILVASYLFCKNELPTYLNGTGHGR